jgi:hypothetical protein
MAEVLGTAATATLVRRAMRRAALKEPGLKDVTIDLTGFDYQYSLPDSWRENGNEQASWGLKLVLQQLRLLLIELTGLVVVRRLERIPSLRRLGMISGEPT